MELVLHLRPRRRREPHPAEQLDELVDHLHQDVPVADLRLESRLGHIHRVPRIAASGAVSR
jgi:hypothetical protein